MSQGDLTQGNLTYYRTVYLFQPSWKLTGDKQADRPRKRLHTKVKLLKPKIFKLLLIGVYIFLIWFWICMCTSRFQCQPSQSHSCHPLPQHACVLFVYLLVTLKSSYLTTSPSLCSVTQEKCLDIILTPPPPSYAYLISHHIHCRTDSWTTEEMECQPSVW